MDPESGTPSEVTALEQDDTKLAVEVNTKRLEKFVSLYETSVHNINQGRNSGADQVGYTLIRDFFDTIGQTPMLQAAENRVKIKGIQKQAEERRIDKTNQAQAAKVKPGWR